MINESNAPKPKGRILLVDDMPDSLELGVYQLGHIAGYELETATTGEETFTLLKAKCLPGQPCFDLILLDIDLPDITGTSVATWVRERYPFMPIVLYTAFGRLPHFVDTANKISGELITKPMDYDELSSLVEREIKYRPAKLRAELEAKEQALKELHATQASQNLTQTKEAPRTLLTYVMEVASKGKLSKGHS